MAAHVSPARPQPVSGLIGAGQRVGDGVEVGADVQAVEDDVVAGVDDRRHVTGRYDVDEAAQEPGRAHAPGQGHDHAGSLRRPAIR